MLYCVFLRRADQSYRGVLRAVVRRCMCVCVCVCVCVMFECYCTVYGTIVCIIVLQPFALRPSTFVMLQSVCYYYYYYYYYYPFYFVLFSILRVLCSVFFPLGDRGSTVLQIGRSLVRFQMVSLKFFIDFIFISHFEY